MRPPLALAALTALASSSLADVLVVDAAGTTPWMDIQAAVDAAQPGDLVLVQSGTYAGFDVIGHDLAVAAHLNAQVKVQGTVSVAATPPGATVRLNGLEITGSNLMPGIWIHDNIGLVRVAGCEVFGGLPSRDGLPGVEVESNSGVLLAGCDVRGGFGYGDSVGVCFGGAGGPGVLSRTTPLAIYDSLVTGGVGGLGNTTVTGCTGGTGGPGIVIEDFGVYLGNSVVRGGKGGFGWDGGDGGTALVLQDNSQAQLLATQLVGGQGGAGALGPNGSQGVTKEGTGTLQVLAGQAREFTAAPLGAEKASLQVTARGLPGDQVWVFTSSQPAHVPALSLGGLWLVKRPGKLPLMPMAVIGASGTAKFQVGLPEVDPGQGARELYLQGWVRTSTGAGRLGSPLHVAVLDCAGIAPDCNANGAWDVCDLLAGVAQDCDANGVLDACESDCNGNGVNDVCDLANGTSEDLNGNGVPDECEALPTIYVDAGAPPGGDGSQSAPFQTIGEAMALAVSGTTIEIAAGTYSGPLNRGLSFDGRELVLQGAGASSTIVDCELAGRFLFNDGGESPASAVRGLRILRGKATGTSGNSPGGIVLDGSSTTIQDCEFVDCVGGVGGAVLTTGLVRNCLFVGCSATVGGGLSAQGSATIRDCQFIDCSAGDGGAVVLNLSSARLVDCHFEGNSALPSGGGRGGAIYALSDVVDFPACSITRCRMIDNVATKGGGLYVDPFFIPGFESPPVLVDQCLFAGNTADGGGAVWSSRVGLNLRSSTLVGNVSSLGSPIEIEGDATTPTVVTLRNSILWDDPLGAPLIDTIGTIQLELQVQRCDVRGGQAAIQIDPAATFVYGPGNLEADPLFADPDGPDNDPSTWADNDLRLGAFSPCADAGDNVFVTPDTYDLDGDLNVSEPTPLDLDDLPRFEDDPQVPDTGAGTTPIVDLGPYERP
jgi:hypothetical protein